MDKGFVRSAWIVALVAVFTLSACTRPENNIGLDLLPEDDLLDAFHTDTITILAEVVLDTAVLTDEINPVLCSRWNDPALGTVNAGFYTQLRLEASNPNFGDEGEVFVDSIILSLAFDELYPTPSREWDPKFNVYRLTEFLELDSSYTSADAIGVDETNLELVPDSAYPLIFFGETDTGDPIDPQVRIALDPSLGDVFVNAPSDSLSSSDAFVNFFEGLYVELQDDVVNQQYQFDLEDGSSRLTMYYRSGLDEDQDTTSFDFTINNNSARYTRVQRTYSGYAQAFNAEVDSIDFTEGQGYLQGGSGFAVRIRFPHITDFNELDGRNINRAELIVPVTLDASTDLDPHDGLIIRERDEEGNLQLIGDHNTLINVDGGYEESTGDFRFILTRHIQDLMNGEADTDNLLILSTNRQNQLLRNIVHGPNYTVEGDEGRMRLRLIFSN